jgi:membrane peptidoglycan carboxypeptidase
LAPYIGGKTGTTENENDAWFAGFSNDVTIAVWVGYDNADGQRRTLGDGETGAKVAIPIFEPIMQGVWAEYARKAVLDPPSAEARRNLIDIPIDLASGEQVSVRGGGAFIEHFRRGAGGSLDDTQYRLVGREDVYPYRDRDMSMESGLPQGWSYNRGYYSQIAPTWRMPPQVQRPGLFGEPFWWGNEDRPRPRRIDPDVPWGSRGLY